MVCWTGKWSAGRALLRHIPPPPAGPLTCRTDSECNCTPSGAKAGTAKVDQLELPKRPARGSRRRQENILRLEITMDDGGIS